MPDETVAVPVSNTQAPMRSWIGPMFLAMAASAVAQGFVRYTFAFVLPAMTEDVFGGSYGLAGLFAAVNLGSYALGVAGVAALASRVDPTVFVKWGLAGCTVGLLLLAAGPSVPVLVVGMALAGGFGAVVWVPLAGVISSWAPPEKRGLVFGLILAGTGLTIALSGVLTERLQAYRGPLAWREVWLLEGVLTLVVLVLVVWRLRPAGGEGAPDVSGQRVRARARGVPVVRVCLTYGIWGIAYGMCVNYLVAALQEVDSISDAEAYRMYGLVGIASILGSVLIGRAADRWGRPLTLGATTGLACVAAVTVGVSTSQILLTATVILFGVVMMGPGVVLPAYLSDSLGPAEVAAVFGSATLCLAVAQAVAPPIGGWIADITGSFTATYLLAAVAAAVSALIAWALPVRTGRDSH